MGTLSNKEDLPPHGEGEECCREKTLDLGKLEGVEGVEPGGGGGWGWGGGGGGGGWETDRVVDPRACDLERLIHEKECREKENRRGKRVKRQKKRTSQYGSCVEEMPAMERKKREYRKGVRHGSTKHAQKREEKETGRQGGKNQTLFLRRNLVHWVAERGGIGDSAAEEKNSLGGKGDPRAAR